MDLEECLREEARRIDDRLDEVLPPTSSGDGSRLVEAMRYSLLAGGKRLRPILCLWSYDALAGARHDGVWSAACGLELVHAYSLVHDDLPAMDDDDLRRGRPSCHRQFDEATAILAGDALQSLAFAAVSRIEPAPLAARLVRILAEASGWGGMAGGQQLDLQAERGSPSAEDLEQIHLLKTGRLLGAALAMGVACAGASMEVQGWASAAGEDLGVAFQIVDDLLDESSSALALGKRVGKDRARGKATAPRLLGTQRARERAHELAQRSGERLQRCGLGTERLLSLVEFVLRRER
jgi:geranylgeranyl pyrophosphate synthase